jgi:hypothetical protein
MQLSSRALLNIFNKSKSLSQANPWSFASAAAPAAAASYSSSASSSLRWVFLGPPGVGKGTYASRIAAALNVPHIAAGDLVRAEIKSGSTLGQQMQAMVSKGQLLPDAIIIEVRQHLSLTVAQQQQQQQQRLQRQH